jgi:hypothetical protein
MLVNCFKPPLLITTVTFLMLDGIVGVGATVVGVDVSVFLQELIRATIAKDVSSIFFMV